MAIMEQSKAGSPGYGKYVEWHGGPEERLPSAKSPADTPQPFVEAWTGAPVSGRKLDPRAQLVILVLINVVTISFSSLPLEIATAGLICCALLWQGMYRTCLKFCLLYSGAFGLLMLSAMYMSPITGVLAFFCIVMRKTLPMFMFAASLIARTSVGELVASLQSARVPQPMIVVLAVTLRFFPTLRQEYRLVMDGLRMRGLGLTPANLLLRPLMVVENVLVPLMVRMASISEEVAAAAVSRGMDSARPRVAYHAPRFKMVDAIFVVSFVLLAVASLLHWPVFGGGR